MTKEQEIEVKIAAGKHSDKLFDDGKTIDIYHYQAFIAGAEFAASSVKGMQWVDIVHGELTPPADTPMIFEMSDGEVYKGIYHEDCGNWWVSIRAEGSSEFDRENFSLTDFTRYLYEG